MNNENFHPVNAVPPLAHALHRYHEPTQTLFYEYNGQDIITVDLKGAKDPGFRHGSDGTMQSVQYTQQIYLTVEKPMRAVVTFTLSRDTINMRLHRACSGEAILGQNERLLLTGVNGLYDVSQDLLIDFHGCPWRFMGEDLSLNEEGRSVAQIEVELSEKPFFINLRMHYYKNHLGYRYHEPWKRKPKVEPIAGWCTWEGYRRGIDTRKIRAASEFLSEKLGPWGLTHVQVDDGYQKMPLPSDPSMTMAQGWMTCEEEKFSGGHGEIVAAITDTGLIPGIWYGANITNPDFPERHPGAVLLKDGSPLIGEWITYLYSCTPECLIEHVFPAFQMFKEAGYRYIKIDAVRHLLLDGLHEAVRMGLLSNEEASDKFRAFMQAARDGMGEETYCLSCWGEMHEVIGLCDACRISMDANPTWASVHMQLFESARWFFTQRVLFLNDPDHVCARTKPEWVKSLLSLVSLSGELYMLSDPLSDYTEEKLAIIRKTLPPLKTRPAETGPLDLSYPAYTWTKLHGFAVQSHDAPVRVQEVTLKEVYDIAGVYPTMDDEHPFSSLWAFHLKGRDSALRWCVMSRFATVPLRASRVELKALGLDETQSFHAFDFWKEHYLGIVTGAIAADALSTGECQIVALHRVKSIPQFIASSRHVSMDAVSVLACEFDGEKLQVMLEGIPGCTERYYFHNNGYEFCCAQAFGAETACLDMDGLVCVTVIFQEKNAELTLKFEK